MSGGTEASRRARIFGAFLALFKGAARPPLRRRWRPVTGRGLVRAALGLRPAPEFEAWLAEMGLGGDTPDVLPARLAPGLIGLS